MKKLELQLKGKIYEVLLDDEDWERIQPFRWYIAKSPLEYTPYVVATINGKRTLMHRFILNAPPELVTDHIDMNGLNNQKSNLRLITRQQNNMGKRKQRSGKSSKFKCVSWNPKRQRWLVQTKVNGKTRYIGLFVDEIDAAKAYDKFAIKTYGEFARLNFPIT
jgi:hypothetical protein